MSKQQRISDMADRKLKLIQAVKNVQAMEQDLPTLRIQDVIDLAVLALEEKVNKEALK